MIYDGFDIKCREHGWTGVEAVMYKKDRNAFQKYFRLGKIFSCATVYFDNATRRYSIEDV